MSFPSAAVFRSQGLAPEQALLRAFETDTPLGWRAISAVVEIARGGSAGTQVPTVPDQIRPTETRGEGVIVDINPNSQTGAEVMRLLGTDCARAILVRHFGCYFGLANCCKILASARNPADIAFSAEEQIDWQSKPDC